MLRGDSSARHFAAADDAANVVADTTRNHSTDGDTDDNIQRIVESGTDSGAMQLGELGASLIVHFELL